MGSNQQQPREGEGATRESASNASQRPAKQANDARVSALADRTGIGVGLPSESLDLRERAWELYLRGVPNTRIGRELSISRTTVAKLLTSARKELGTIRKDRLAQMQIDAVARMRRVQEQAWIDHDTDDARELHVLNTCLARAEYDAHDEGEEGEKRRESQQRPAGAVRYQSQRSQYLRVILDAEKEIARLQGLYEGVAEVEAAVVFRIERIGEGGVTTSSVAQGGIQAGVGDGSSDRESEPEADE